MSETTEFVSVFKINGRPILPPAMTPKRRKEMQEYKKKALEIEKRLKEKKKGEREPTGVLDHLDKEGDKENNRFSANECRNKDSMNITYKVKSVLSGKESSKDLIPQFLQKSVETNFSAVCDSTFGEDYAEEAHSVAFTESTDLHPYLNSSIEDEICSSEAEFITEFASASKMGNSQACDSVQYNSRENSVEGLTAVESLFDCAASSTSGVYSRETEETVDTTAMINVSDSKLPPGVISGQVNGSDLVNSSKALGSTERVMKVLEVDFTHKINENINTGASAGHHSDAVVVCPLQKILCGDDGADNSHLSPLQSESQPTRIIRTNSFTMETPSPLLMANIEQFTVDAVSEDKSVLVNEKNETFVCRKENNSDAGQKTFVLPSKSLPPSSPKDKVEVCHVKSTKRGASLSEGEMFKEDKRDQVKNGNRRATVFERLAADAARKAEERKKLSRKNSSEIFKVPKKIAKTSFRGLRPSLSTSNLRTSLSGAHKNRSNPLANRRTNSEANVSSGHRKSVMLAANSQKQKTSSKVASLNLCRKPVVINFRSHAVKNADPGTCSSEDLRTLEVEKDLECFHTSEEHPLAKLTGSQLKNTVGSNKESIPERVMYCVQTSPISPAIPNEPEVFSNAGQALADSELAEASHGGRRRRRWSLGWSGWVTSVGEQSDSDNPESGIGSCIVVEPTESVCCGQGELEVETQSAGNDVSNYAVEIEVDAAEHEEVNSWGEPSENHVEKELTTSYITESQGQSRGFREHLLEKRANQSIQGETNSGTQNVLVDQEEPIIPSPKEPSCTVTSESNTFLENNGEGPMLDISVRISNEGSVYSRETAKHAVKSPPSVKITLSPIPSSPADSFGTNEPASKISPFVEKTLNSIPASPAGSVGIKETALKLLSCLVEEQDKAMARLLEDQRVQAEKMRERFMLQQKCLVERVAHLVSSMSTPPMPKSNSLRRPRLDEDAVVTGKDSVISSKSPPQSNHEITITQLSTPRCPGNTVNKLSHPICSSEEVLLTKLELHDVLEDKTSKDVMSELESEHIKTPEKEGLPPTENSICQVCLTFTSNCHCCSQEESSCSSTIREEITALSVGSLDNVTITATVTSEGESSVNGDKLVCSSSPLQEVNSDNALGHSPGKPVGKVVVNPYVDKTNLTLREDLLDLSEILEMEFGCKSANAQSQIPCIRADKSKRNPEEIHDISTLSSAQMVGSTNDHATITSPLGHLSSYRQMYEQDLLRLKQFESIAEKDKPIDGPLANEPVTSLKDSMRNPDYQSPVPNATPCKLWKTVEYERKDVQFDMLPDLKSDVLQAYLGSQTPSTGPVFLQTPVASACHQSRELPASSTPSELLENCKLSELPSKEVAQCEREDTSSVLISPVTRETLEYEEGEEVSSHELHLSIRSSSSSSTSYPHDQSRHSSEPNCSLNNSHSSGHYTTASSSKCLSGNLSGFERKSMLNFWKLSAFVKGYLTRRLLRTEKVHRIKITIRDLILAALKLHSEISQEDNVNQHDVTLHGQILAELNATCEDFHHIFFELSTAQQMALISADRQRLKSSSSSSAIFDEERITPRPALLSAVTLKTLQRRFSAYSPKNGAKNTLQPKRNENQEKVSPICTLAAQRTIKAENGREPICRRSTSRTKSISEGVNSKSARAMMGSKCTVPRKGSVLKASDLPTKSLRRKRRSASAGEMKRRPWR